MITDVRADPEGCFIVGQAGAMEHLHRSHPLPRSEVVSHSYQRNRLHISPIYDDATLVAEINFLAPITIISFTVFIHSLGLPASRLLQASSRETTTVPFCPFYNTLPGRELRL